jgi:hypothetical protein
MLPAEKLNDVRSLLQVMVELLARSVATAAKLTADPLFATTQPSPRTFKAAHLRIPGCSQAPLVVFNQHGQAA